MLSSQRLWPRSCKDCVAFIPHLKHRLVETISESARLQLGDWKLIWLWTIRLGAQRKNPRRLLPKRKRKIELMVIISSHATLIRLGFRVTWLASHSRFLGHTNV